MEKDTKWLLVTGGTAMVAGLLTKSALKTGWNALYGEDPPMNPADPDTAWKEALAWTLAISVVGGLARLGARRGAAKMLHDRKPKDVYG